jgi:RNA polymerase sigma factor (sigma-70 family)
VRDEKQLILDFKRTGNLEFLGKLYEPYMPLLYGVCFKYFNDKEQSEDAVMAIFESLIEKLAQHEVTHFKSWLYTLTKNHCLMELRKTKKHQQVELNDDLPASEESFNPMIEIKLTGMEACLEKLPEEQQWCIRLFYLEHKCYQDIAVTTGFDLKKVKSYLQNGKRNLKICMEKMGYGESI